MLLPEYQVLLPITGLYTIPANYMEKMILALSEWSIMKKMLSSISISLWKGKTGNCCSQVRVVPHSHWFMSPPNDSEPEVKNILQMILVLKCYTGDGNVKQRWLSLHLYPTRKMAFIQNMSLSLTLVSPLPGNRRFLTVWVLLAVLESQSQNPRIVWVGRDL